MADHLSRWDGKKRWEKICRRLTDKKRMYKQRKRVTPDPIGIFFSELWIFNKGEEIDRSLDPEEKDPFQEDSNQATGCEEAMQQDEIPLDEKGEGKEPGQKEIGPEKGQKYPLFSIQHDFLQRRRRSGLQMISVES
jgi:hypothetical protein